MAKYFFYFYYIKHLKIFLGAVFSFKNSRKFAQTIVADADLFVNGQFDIGCVVTLNWPISAQYSEVCLSPCLSCSPTALIGVKYMPPRHI